MWSLKESFCELALGAAVAPRDVIPAGATEDSTDRVRRDEKSTMTANTTTVAPKMKTVVARRRFIQGVPCTFTEKWGPLKPIVGRGAAVHGGWLRI